VLFRQFRLLTAQAGSIPAAIRLIFENCYNDVLSRSIVLVGKRRCSKALF